jgi:heme-degrading monooxygenase HmoA
MARIWTHGIWTAKAGHESDFVAAWRELVPLGSSYGSDDPRLLRDREHTNVYRSFGSWRSLEDIASFRDAIAPRVSAMDDLLVSFETFTLDEAYPGD